MKDLVLLLNLQKSYFDEAGSLYLGEHAKDMRARLLEYVKSLDLRSHDLIFTLAMRTADDPFYSGSPSANMVGSGDIDTLTEFLPYTKSRVITRRPSAMQMSPLGAEIKKLAPRRIYIVGAETHSSVCFTAADLRMQGYEVKVPEPLVISRDMYLHGSGITLMTMEFGVDVTSF